ncbi:putative alpha-ketoglutarate-dependent dioxygenase ABH5 [Hordeum vulgare]|nr:putative alpha-ketoglutarate-dependent dioxygenase ABH5 [Hordeum vulgare]
MLDTGLGPRMLDTGLGPRMPDSCVACGTRSRRCTWMLPTITLSCVPARATGDGEHRRGRACGEGDVIDVRKAISELEHMPSPYNLFRRDMKVLAPGEFSAAASIPLPVGSVLVLNGNGADVAKHSVPVVPAKRISITFRKMDASKVPFGFRPDLLLQSLAAAAVRQVMTAASAPPNRAAWEQRQGEAAKHATPQQQQHQWQAAAPLYQEAAAVRAGQAHSPGGGVPFSLSTDEFPALGASPASGRRQGKR